MSNEQNAANGAGQKSSELVLILDCGSQYAQLLAQCVRDAQVYCEIAPGSTTAEEIAARKPVALILAGGAEAPKFDAKIVDLDLPVLSVCCCPMMNACADASCEVAELTLTAEGRVNPLMSGLSEKSQVWAKRKVCEGELPSDFVALATTPASANAAFAHKTKPVFGLQFYPESERSIEGKRIISNFLKNVCKISGDWTTKKFVEDSIAQIRAQVGSERVVCGLSGGVDSAVTAALVARAIGSQLTCIFVDTGLMRKNELESVEKVFRENFESKLVVVKAEDRFLGLLAGVEDPQQKRKIIGKTFIDVFAEEAKKIDGAKFLAQGTIYPDIIESGVGNNKTVKFHHNVGGLPDDLEFELVEPLRDLFKGDVRRVGLELGLPENIVWRHPFPGPGLGVRCLGALTKAALDKLREADAIVVDEIVKAGLYRQTSQVFAVLLPVKSVGVKNGERTYENAVAVRCIKTTDFMTADWCEIPYEVLAKISTRIIAEVDGVNRVVYDISPKPPATIEWE